MTTTIIYGPPAGFARKHKLGIPIPGKLAQKVTKEEGAKVRALMSKSATRRAKTIRRGRPTKSRAGNASALLEVLEGAQRNEKLLAQIRKLLG